MATSGPPSEAAKRLQGLKLSNKVEWRRTLEWAFQGGATMNEAAERLGAPNPYKGEERRTPSGGARARRGGRAAGARSQ